MHPMVFAAWFGMLATALNLLPFGQLDGGHITYATLGGWSRYISLATVAGAIVMTLRLEQLAVHDGDDGGDAGPARPAPPARALRSTSRSAAGRYVVALIALVMFILCFTRRADRDAD